MSVHGKFICRIFILLMKTCSEFLKINIHTAEIQIIIKPKNQSILVDFFLLHGKSRTIFGLKRHMSWK